MSAVSSPPADAAPRPHRRRAPLIAGAVVLAVLVLLAVAAGLSWHFSSAVLVPDRSSHYPTSTVQSVAAGQVVLSRSDDTSRPGVYGLDWSGGHAIVEAVLDRSPGAVTRRLTALSGRLVKGMTVSIDPNVYIGNPRSALGLPFEEVRIPDELGPMPAWLVPGHTRTWTIFVHGINAARYALAHGARHLVLAGYSMVGAIVAQFMERSPLARHVAGLVLDSPALDWQAILSFNAEQLGLPSFAALPVEWNVDPALYDRRLAAFLAHVGA